MGSDELAVFEMIDGSHFRRGTDLEPLDDDASSGGHLEFPTERALVSPLNQPLPFEPLEVVQAGLSVWTDAVHGGWVAGTSSEDENKQGDGGALHVARYVAYRPNNLSALPAKISS